MADSSANQGAAQKPPRRNNSCGTFHAVPDPHDPADHDFTPAGNGPPAEVPVEAYLALGLPMMDQGDEWACTGFGLAAVANYLLRRRPALIPVSPRMLYEMAKRSEGGSDKDHQGSSARAALKGWHKQGVCSSDLWPYVADQPDHDLTAARREDARKRPLLRYARVDEESLETVRAAIAEVGIVYVTAHVHEGWKRVGADGRIPLSDDQTGTHAFALVGYDADGFWLHNSRGESWGKNGFGYLCDEDWNWNAVDAWVAYADRTDTRG